MLDTEKGSRPDGSTAVTRDQTAATIVIAATFTAEPLSESLDFWCDELQLDVDFQFAPYNQVFQQLIDPGSLVSRNANGLNVIMLRLADWLTGGSAVGSYQDSTVEKNVEDLVVALRSVCARSSSSFLVCLCPDPPAAGTVQTNSIHQRIEQFLSSELSELRNAHFLGTSVLMHTYPVSTHYDPYSDQVGRVPYTPEFFTSLGTAVIRRFHSVYAMPYKVIVLDCDHTLWNGVCGEDGAFGVRLDQPHIDLQQFVLRQLDAGMIACLCSKNDEDDVMQVFARRPEMLLKFEHVVSSRINWRPKSENIRSLAQELGLGMDSFIFIDDNPVECAEVSANCPDVLTLQLPNDRDQFGSFLEHVWAFDRLEITEEDKRRTDMYRQNAKREKFRREALTFDTFLKGLALEVSIFQPAEEQLSRVAQLTRRTNQFNFTTVRRTDAELVGELQSRRLECICVDVSDRFGKYGLVGVVLFSVAAEVITIDTFLLSCRVLGRGIEHCMLAKLGEIALQRDIAWVEAPFVTTPKNMPALDFLESVGRDCEETTGTGLLFRFAAQHAAALTYDVPAGIDGTAGAASSNTVSGSVANRNAGIRSQRLSAIARDYRDVSAIFGAIESRRCRQRQNLANEFMVPATLLQRDMAQIWQKVLAVNEVGIDDSFSDLGGTSLAGVRVIAELNRQLNLELSIVDLFDTPTIRSLTAKLNGNRQSADTSATLLASRKRGEARRLRTRYTLR